MNVARSTSLVLLAAAALSAQAQNLVRDGGFENSGSGGYNAGESLGGGPWTATGFRTIVERSDDAISGEASLVLFFAGTGATQTLATVAGRRYTLSFAAYDTFSPTTLRVGFGAATFDADVPGTYLQPERFTFDVVAEGPSTVLSLSSPDGGLTYVDDVSVVAAVPEPASLAALGVGAFALLRRRRDA